MNTWIKHALAPLAATGALLFAGLPPVSADEHFIRTFAAGEVCSFPLGYSATGGKLQTIEFSDRNRGPVLLIQAGRGVILTYTNLQSGESVTINTAGSVLRVVENRDGTITGYITGHYGLIFTEVDEDEPGVLQYTGRAQFTIGAGNAFGKVTNSGQVRDICTELAS